MTAPEQPEQPSGDQQRPARRPARALDVVEYTHRDPILGHEHLARGVVITTGGDGAPAVVQPLAGHRVQVDPDTLRPLTAADVAEG